MRSASHPEFVNLEIKNASHKILDNLRSLRVVSAEKVETLFNRYPTFAEDTIRMLEPGSSFVLFCLFSFNFKLFVTVTLSPRGVVAGLVNKVNKCGANFEDNARLKSLLKLLEKKQISLAASGILFSAQRLS